MRFDRGVDLLDATGRLRSASVIDARILARSKSTRAPSFFTTEGSAISARS